MFSQQIGSKPEVEFRQSSFRGLRYTEHSHQKEKKKNLKVVKVALVTSIL